MRKQSSKSSFTGKTFLFSGTLQSLTRSEAEKIIKANGGALVKAVSEKLNYLVVGHKAGSTPDQAGKIKTIKILEEKDFLKLVAAAEKSVSTGVLLRGEIIDLIHSLIQHFDPSPVMVNEDFPLRWESGIFVQSYDFTDNHLGLDEKYERSNGLYLKSVGTAVEISLEPDGRFEYRDGAFMTESHAWCSKLNTTANWPSFSLIHRKFRTIRQLKKYLDDYYGLL